MVGESELILKKADWLKEYQKEAIEEGVRAQSGLNLKHEVKLIKILAAIPYAEENQDEHGKKITQLVSNLAPVFKKSLSSWQLNMRNAHFLGRSPDEFRKIMEEDKTAIHEVITFLRSYIGLDKTPETIFAEWNMGVDTTVVYPLQKVLNASREFLLSEHKEHEDKLANLLDHKEGHARASILDSLREHRGKKLDNQEQSWLDEWPIISEDGFWGEGTRKAFESFSKFLHDEARVEHYFDQIKGDVPQHRERRGLSYLLRNLKHRRFRKALNFFANHVDVPKYVRVAMSAYKRL